MFNNYSGDIETRLISLKSNFTGQSFQWIKPDDSSLLAKVVKCRDIILDNRGQFVAVFDDGSRILTEFINSKLMMITSDMQALTLEEVRSIYGGVKSSMSSQSAKPTTPSEPKTDLVQENTPQVKKSINTSSIFSMFNSEETSFIFKLLIKLPDKKLLKMMYQNSENKEEFLNQLSQHIHNSITIENVKDSINDFLSIQTKKNNSITINEVN
jgi:hypothetical protein